MQLLSCARQFTTLARDSVSLKHFSYRTTRELWISYEGYNQVRTYLHLYYAYK